jgi:hypothetical protein
LEVVLYHIINQPWFISRHNVIKFLMMRTPKKKLHGLSPRANTFMKKCSKSAEKRIFGLQCLQDFKLINRGRYRYSGLCPVLNFRVRQHFWFLLVSENKVWQSPLVMWCQTVFLPVPDDRGVRGIGEMLIGGVKSK